jgi:hypothetical protein
LGVLRHGASFAVLRDVHQVLALPEGALLEYQYRDRRVTDDVVAASHEPLDALPRDLLVVYAQWKQFSRGDEDPERREPRPPADEMLFQATRRGTLVGLWRTGEHISFQLKLSAHPKADPNLLTPLIDELVSRAAAPYEKWVSFSESRGVLDRLKPEDEALEWQKTVDRLTTPPMQFGADKFVRFDPPRRKKRKKGEELQSKYEARAGNSHALDHWYVVPERCRFDLTLASHERTGTPADRSAHYEILLPNDGSLTGPDQPRDTLRRNALTTLPFESGSATKRRIDRTLAIKIDDALPEPNDPISFHFQIRIARWKLLVGGLLGTIGAISVVLGPLLHSGKDISFLAMIGMLIGGASVAATGGLLATGVWKFTI